MVLRSRDVSIALTTAAGISAKRTYQKNHCMLLKECMTPDADENALASLSARTTLSYRVSANIDIAPAILQVLGLAAADRYPMAR
jgi:hypothetical protein